jgi:hydrogenase maturation protease
LLIGVGNRDRSDDGIGPIVADLVEGATASVLTMVREGDLAVLPLLWNEDDDVVIVDACRCAGSVGSVHQVDPDALMGGTSMSTHGMNVADAVQLAHRLDRAPRRLRVFGVIGKSFDYGTLSCEMRSALPDIVDVMLDVLGVRRDV